MCFKFISAGACHPYTQLSFLLWMVTNSKHLLDHGELCGWNVLIVYEGEEEGFVRGHVAPLHGGLAPRNITEPTTDLSMLALRRRKDLL